MSISIKGKKDIENMKIAGKKAAAVLKMLEKYVKLFLHSFEFRWENCFFAELFFARDVFQE